MEDLRTPESSSGKDATVPPGTGRRREQRSEDKFLRSESDIGELEVSLEESEEDLLQLMESKEIMLKDEISEEERDTLEQKILRQNEIVKTKRDILDLKRMM